MEFIATIVKEDETVRLLEHESRFDAMSVLVEEITARLGPGERIADAVTQGPRRSRRVVPAIERVS